MLTLDNVSFSYSRLKPLISDFSLSLGPGMVCGLLGANGSGKTTLLYLMSGLLRPKEGTVRFNDMIPSDRKTAFLENVFLVPEEFSLPQLTVGEFVGINAPFYPCFDRNSFLRNLELFEIDESMNLAKISMGQKKKALLSFALACGTKLLLLDEPTNGLDISAKRAFRQAVASCMDDERIILISTHQIFDVDKILDHVVVTSPKGVLLNAGVDEITSSLRFLFTSDRDRASAALLSLPCEGGYSIVERLCPGDDETDINLEALYELVRKGFKI